MARRSVPDIVEPRKAPQTGAVPRSLARHLLVSLRPPQWTKNLIIFAGLIFGQRLGEPVAVGRAVGAFVVFCVLSGVVYLVNDVVDREADRQHPVKSRRPIAAGELPVGRSRSAGRWRSARSGLAAAFWLGRTFGLVAAPTWPCWRSTRAR